MPIFDPEIVHQCSMECLGLPKPQMFDVFARSLAKHHPKVLDFGQPWKYIMIWGMPIGSKGHSGRHFTGFWDTVIDGEMWYYGEGEFEKKIYKPGDRVYVGPGQARAMNFTNGVWAVEYARGFIPASVPFGIPEEVFVCWDLLTATQTLSLYTDLVAQSFGQKYAGLKPVSDSISQLARKVTNALIPSPEVSKIPQQNIRWFQRKT